MIVICNNIQKILNIKINVILKIKNVMHNYHQYNLKIFIKWKKKDFKNDYFNNGRNINIINLIQLRN